jgi:signal peptidase I
VFFIIYLSLHSAIFYAILVLFFNSIFWVFIISVFPLGIFSILAGLDASSCVKKSRRNYGDNVQAPVKNPWLVVFLSLVWPGLGHAYLRKWFLFILYSLIYLSFSLLDSHFKICRLLLRILVCIHVGRIFSDTITKRDFYKFVVATVLILFTVNFAIPVLKSRYVIKGIFVKQRSMEPTLKMGDLILINRLAYTFDEPKIGDIVEIDSNVAVDLNPKLRHHLKLNLERPYFFIKRIAAVGGDSVQLKKDGVYVNDILQKDIMVGNSTGPTTLKINGLKIDRIATQNPYRVPENCFFTIGDNIKNSFDSRDFGAIPGSMITGKVIKVFSPKREK